MDILCGHVPRAGSDGGKDHHPLGREPVSGASEGIEKIVCFGQIISAPARECLSLPHLKEVKGILLLLEDNAKGGTCETFSRSHIESPLRNP